MLQVRLQPRPEIGARQIAQVGRNLQQRRQLRIESRRWGSGHQRLHGIVELLIQVARATSLSHVPYPCALANVARPGTAAVSRRRHCAPARPRPRYAALLGETHRDHPALILGKLLHQLEETRPLVDIFHADLLRIVCLG